MQASQNALVQQTKGIIQQLCITFKAYNDFNILRKYLFLLRKHYLSTSHVTLQMTRSVRDRDWSHDCQKPLKSGTVVTS